MINRPSRFWLAVGTFLCFSLRAVTMLHLTGLPSRVRRRRLSRKVSVFRYRLYRPRPPASNCAYGFGMTACVSFEYPLSFELPSTAAAT
jgi:hypothetical protein